MHLQYPAHALARSLDRVVDGAARLDAAGIDAEEAELADIRVGRDLEGQRREGLAVARMADILLLGLGIDAADSRYIQRGRHIIHNGVKQLLDTLVAIGRAAQHRNKFVRDGALADGRLELLLGDGRTLKVFLHDAVIDLSQRLDHLGTVLLGLLAVVLRDLLAGDIAQDDIKVGVGLHIDQINQADIGILKANGYLDGHGTAAEAVAHHVNDMIKVGAHDIHLVDIGHARHLVLVGLPPNGFRLGLNAALCAENSHRAVKHTQRTLHLNGKVHMARRINDVDAAVLPVSSGCSRGNRYASLLLLNHPVHGSSAVMRLANLMVNASIE